MKQNFGKKKTGIVVVMSMIVALTLSPWGSDQAAAIQDNNNTLLSVESNSSLTTDKTIRLMAGEPSFVPNFIQISVGEKITFVNVDGRNGGMAHSIVSVNNETGIPDNTFDSGLLMTGDRFEIQFDDSGIYYYVDSMYHSEMHGIIVVIE